MDKETKERLRKAGWTEEEIVELEMEEKNVTISKERYKELLQKEGVPSEGEAFEALKEALIADLEVLEEDLTEVQQLMSKGDRELIDKIKATDKWEDLFEVMQAIAYDVSQALYMILSAYGIEKASWEFPLQGWST